MFGVPKIRGTILGIQIYKDYSILGPILGSPYEGKLPCIDRDVWGSGQGLR